MGCPLSDWHLSYSSVLSFCTAICKRCKEHLIGLMKDFSVELSLENTPCLEEAPSASVISEIVSPSETQSSECSEQEMEERVNLLKWSHFNMQRFLLAPLVETSFEQIDVYSGSSLTLRRSHANAYPHCGTEGGGWMEPPPPTLVFVVIRHIKLVCVL